MLATLEHMGIGCKQTAAHSPWQNGVAERWVATVRRELLDHVIVQRAVAAAPVAEYVAHDRDDRTHLGLGGDAGAAWRGGEPSGAWEVVAFPWVGGLHHRYEWRAAA